MPNERNNNIKYVRLNNQNSFLRALPENFTYLVVTHCIIRFISKFLILPILSYLSKSAHPRTSKKHGKGQADGSGQVFHTGSLGRIIWDVQVEWVWVEFYSTPFVFFTDTFTGKFLCGGDVGRGRGRLIFFNHSIYFILKK
jgi:hypothetical protein